MLNPAKLASVSILAVWLSLPLFASQARASASTYSQTTCYTKLTTKKPASVPSTTLAKTLTITRTVRSIMTPTKTVIPSSATASTTTTMVSSTTLTLTQETDTYTSTSTETDTVIPSTDTTFSTILSTSVSTTVITDTTTISTSAGFTPLASAIAAGGNTASKNKLRMRMRGASPDNKALNPRANAQCTFKLGPGGVVTISPSLYPAAVTCGKLVEIVSTSTSVSTAKTTVTVTALRGTTTKTSTSVRTTTYTISPVRASTTLTASTTVVELSFTTSTYYSTSIISSVSTSNAPQATFYAACSADNVVSAVNGNEIDFVAYYGASQQPIYTNAESAYDCCVQCQTLAGCTTANYHEYSSCWLTQASGACDGGHAYPPLPSDGVSFGTMNGSIYGYVVSNGNCGQFAYYGNNE